MLIGHPHNNLTRAYFRRIEANASGCIGEGDRRNCLQFDATNADWEGASGSPILDLDGAARGLYSGYQGVAVGANAQKALRMDFAAAMSPYVRKVVRDQAPGVLESLSALNLLDVGVDEPEADAQQWGRLTACNVPATTGAQGAPAGWSIFYFDDRFSHLMHLRVWSDGAPTSAEGTSRLGAHVSKVRARTPGSPSRSGTNSIC